MSQVLSSTVFKKILFLPCIPPLASQVFGVFIPSSFLFVYIFASIVYGFALPFFLNLNSIPFIWLSFFTSTQSFLHIYPLFILPFTFSLFLYSIHFSFPLWAPKNWSCSESVTDTLATRTHTLTVSLPTFCSLGVVLLWSWYAERDLSVPPLFDSLTHTYTLQLLYMPPSTVYQLKYGLSCQFIQFTPSRCWLWYFLHLVSHNCGYSLKCVYFQCVKIGTKRARLEVSHSESLADHM